MVVRLHLERDRETVAQIDHARVLPWAHQHARPLGGQLAQQLARVLVGTVLRPHEREDRELECVRLAPETPDDLLVLGVGEAELAMRRRRLGHAAPARGEPAGLNPERSSETCATSESKSLPPSVEPVSGSTACSGCGISPNTFFCRLATAAMLRSDPLGL